MNLALRTGALARRNKWVGLFIFCVRIFRKIFCLCAPAYLADGFFRLLGQICWAHTSGLVTLFSDENLVAIGISRHRVMLFLCRPLFLFFEGVLIKCATLNHGSCSILRLLNQFNLIQINRTSNIIKFLLICRRLIVSTLVSFEFYRRILFLG